MVCLCQAITYVHWFFVANRVRLGVLTRMAATKPLLAHVTLVAQKLKSGEVKAVQFVLHSRLFNPKNDCLPVFCTIPQS